MSSRSPLPGRNTQTTLQLSLFFPEWYHFDVSGFLTRHIKKALWPVLYCWKLRMFFKTTVIFSLK